MIFYIDRSKKVKISYQDILDFVNANKIVDNHLIYQDSESFYKKLIYNICNNINTTIYDQGAAIDQEIIVGVDSIKSNIAINNLLELRQTILNSTSISYIFTSGTTGQPKQVGHTIKNLVRSVKIDQKYNHSVWGLAYNPTHMAGLQVFFQAVLNFNPLVNLFEKSRDEVFGLLEEFQITHISATPTFYRLLMPVVKQYPSVLRASVGGEKSDEILLNNIKKKFPSALITNIYASTEAGSLLAAKGHVFTIPKPLINKIKIIDNELLIHKDLIGNSASLQLVDDWYKTQDTIEWIDKEAVEFVFKGRNNEMINTGGNKVNASEVENMIRSIEGVKDALVYGKPNSVLGNIVCADVVINTGYQLDEIAIKKELLNLLQQFKIPRKIYFVDELMYGRTGKIKRQ